MRAARTAIPSPGLPASDAARSDIAPAQGASAEIVARPAVGEDDPAASPVHDMHAMLLREFEQVTPRPRGKLDPAGLAVVLGVALYTLAFWGGLFAIAAAWLHHVPAR